MFRRGVAFLRRCLQCFGGKDSQGYQSHLVKWLILENEKKTTVSQFWRKKGKTYQKSFRLMVNYQKMMVLKFKQIE